MSMPNFASPRHLSPRHRRAKEEPEKDHEPSQIHGERDAVRLALLPDPVPQERYGAQEDKRLESGGWREFLCRVHPARGTDQHEEPYQE